jgi:hypothetical protein
VRSRALACLTLGLLLAGCDRLSIKPDDSAQKAAEAKAQVSALKPLAPGTTPMNERVAVLGILNKRNGIARDIQLKPGQAVRIKDLIVRLRACETSPPWEFDKLTGAFVQVDVQQPDGGWNRVFSGWLYKESPSLNVVEHRVYDVWPKSCAMTFPAAADEAGALSGDSSPSSNDQSGSGASPAERRASPSNPT